MSRRINVTIKGYDDNKDWSKDHSLDPEMSIGEVINDLLSSNRIEPFRSDGTRIEYGLFKDDGVQIDRGKKVGEVLRSGETVYLSDEKNPWFIRQPNFPQSQPSRPRETPQTEPFVRPKERSTYACRLHLARGCVFTIPHESIVIDRDFLLKHLPAGERLRQEVEIRLYGDSALGRVSRDRHCEIFRQGDRWILRAIKPVYADDRTYKDGMTRVIDNRVKIIVGGPKGWPIDIELYQP
jgi:hypothetical protein